MDSVWVDKHSRHKRSHVLWRRGEYSTCGLEAQVTQLTLLIRGEDSEELALRHRAKHRHMQGLLSFHRGRV